MELEQLAYLGELIAAIAVVVSLIYLARQVAQNTQAMRTNSEAMWSNVNLQLAQPIALDRAAAEWWVAGTANYDELDAIDQHRHILWEYGVFQMWWSVFLAHERGMVADEQWDVYMNAMEMFGKRQAIRAAWKVYKPLFNEDFRRLVSEHLES